AQADGAMAAAPHRDALAGALQGLYQDPGRAFRTHDPDHVRLHMSQVFCRHSLQVRAEPKGFGFSHTETPLRQLSFNTTIYDGRDGEVWCDIAPCDNIHLIQFSLAGTAEIRHAGAEVLLRPGEMCALDLSLGAKVRFNADYRHFTIKIPTTALTQLIAQDEGRNCPPLQFTPHAVPLVGQAAALGNFVSLLCSEMQGPERGLTHSRMIDTTEQMLMRLLLLSLPNNYYDHHQPAAGPAIPYYIRRAEDFMRANLREPVTLDAIIQAAGISSRSLQAGFRRHRQDTPLGYLKKLRLDSAHRALRAGRGNVTQIALETGFTHLSKFARDYRERFGETPSETLMRGASK
ncbi:MAG TPA: AraC family transcriptional regulator, partial [Novosphingobium sp.]|nr:AraC family transcriptional regulator [Novosphingobium sp.]